MLSNMNQGKIVKYGTHYNSPANALGSPLCGDDDRQDFSNSIKQKKGEKLIPPFNELYF